MYIEFAGIEKINEAAPDVVCVFLFTFQVLVFPLT